MKLPRQTYKTAADDAAEEEISVALAAHCNWVQLKIGCDPEEEMKSAIDRLGFRDGIVRGFFEAKRCTYRFGELPAGWTIAVDKITAGRKLHEVTRLPVIIVVRFECGTLAWIDVHHDYELILKWGRRDRNDPLDLEDGARFPWSNFVRVKLRSD